MNNSIELAELFKALSLFQGELENATKEIDKPGITYKYADLAICINTAKPHLSKNGLAVTQMLGMSENGKQSITTMLTHSSGQYISSETELPQAVLHGSSGRNPAQVLGSAITYMRRYCFAAMTGMAQEDDDGQGCEVKANKGNDNNNKTKSNNGNAHELDWYNEPDYQADLEGMTSAIRGGTPPEQVIQQISTKFKISNKYRDLIKSI